MRLVLKYTVGDGCTYHCDVVLPVEYESGEALLVDFEDAAQKARKANRSWYMAEFTLAGHEFLADSFFEDGVYCPPEVLTVDEWFNQP